MPYIAKELRSALDANPYLALVSGELNYVITKLILHGLGHDKSCPHEWHPEDVKDLIQAQVNSYVEKAGVSYRTYNEVFGVITCVALEMNRRDKISPDEYLKVVEALAEFMQDYYEKVVAPYEERKKEENGDVYA